MYGKKKMYGSSRMKKGMGGRKLYSNGGAKVGSPYVYDDSTGKYTIYGSEAEAENAAKGKRGVRVGTMDEGDLSIYKDQKKASPKSSPKKDNKPATKSKTITGPNSAARVRKESQKTSRVPKKGMSYVRDEKGNYVFYSASKDASARTAAEKQLGASGKISSGKVGDIFMEERPDKMKKMQKRGADVSSKSKAPEKLKTPKKQALKDMGIEESKEVKFDAPSKANAKTRMRSEDKVAKAKAKQEKRTAKLTERKKDKKPKEASDRQKRKAVRKETRQDIKQIRQEGRAERRAIRKGM